MNLLSFTKHHTDVSLCQGKESGKTAAGTQQQRRRQLEAMVNESQTVGGAETEKH